MNFETGKTYSTASVCDSNCIFQFTVTRRTAKFITTVDRHGEERRSKVFVRDGIECARPLGSYSMAPMIEADDVDPS